MERTEAIAKLRKETNLSLQQCIPAWEESGGDYEKAKQILVESSRKLTLRNADRLTAEGVVAVAKASDAVAIVEVNCETDFAANSPALIEFANWMAQDVHSFDSTDEEIEAKRKSISAELGENVIIRRKVCLVTSDSGSYVHHNHKQAAALSASCEGGHESTKEAYDELLSSLAKHITAAKPIYVSLAEMERIEPEKVAEARVQFTAEVANKPKAIQERIVTGKLDKWASSFALLNQSYIFDDKLTISQVLANFTKATGRQVTVHGFVRYDIKE